MTTDAQTVTTDVQAVTTEELDQAKLQVFEARP